MTVHLQLGGAATKLEGAVARVYAGRDPSACQLAHMDPTLSRRHAEIFVDGGQCFIRDLGSANGTWVDGRPVAKEVTALQPGQQVFLGHVPLVVTWEQGGQFDRTLRGARVTQAGLMVSGSESTLASVSYPAEWLRNDRPAFTAMTGSGRFLLGYEKYGTSSGDSRLKLRVVEVTSVVSRFTT